MPGYFLMRRDLALPIAPAPLPAGISLIPFTPDAAPGCLEVMTRAYGEVGYPPMPFDQWYGGLLADPEYDPALIGVAQAGGAVVACCHCWTVPFIKDLVVEREWRRRGLGAALLTIAITTFKARAAPFVDLKTDVDNVAAQSLYQRLGFTIVERIG